jgi:molybdate transport system substrate-binding protein
MRKLVVVLCLVLLPTTGWAGSVRVAAAISLKDAVQEVAKQFTADTKIQVEFTFGASGQLEAQIHNGAPIDLFISAANKQVDDLIKTGEVNPATRAIIAVNTLVLIVPADSNFTPTSAKDLTDANITHIAIGEPGTVPAGQYAMQVLRHDDLADALKPKLVYGTNVRQVLDYVIRGEASAGIVYGTDALEAGDKVKTTATFPEDSHEPIVYPAVVVKSSADAATAKQFLAYLESDKGQAVLKKFGFAQPPAAETKPAP